MYFLDRLFNLERMEVQGNSMEPELKSGDRIVVKKTGNALEIGDIVVLCAPQKNHRLVKRIVQKNGNQLFVEGDNKNESTDSRMFGWIHENAVLGKAVKKY